MNDPLATCSPDDWAYCAMLDAVRHFTDGPSDSCALVTKGWFCPSTKAEQV